MTPELEKAIESLQTWMDDHPEHVEPIFGSKHAIVHNGSEAISCGLNFYSAQRIAESFHKSNLQHDLDSITIRVPGDGLGRPDYWVIVSRSPMTMGDLLTALRREKLDDT